MKARLHATGAQVNDNADAYAYFWLLCSRASGLDVGAEGHFLCARGLAPAGGLSAAAFGRLVNGAYSVATSAAYLCYLSSTLLPYCVSDFNHAFD